MPEITVLCVDPDEPGGSSPVDDLASEPSVRLVRRTSVAGAKETISKDLVDCVVTEYELPDGTGMELISHVREAAPDTGCILCTDVERHRIATESEADHLAEFVSKDAPTADTRVAQLAMTTAEQRSQTAYPLPRTEQERLATLAEYELDSELFLSAIQRVTDLAAEHFDVAQSSVNIVTERTQEFLACHGEEWGSTSRENSVCAYTILNEGVTVVEDTQADPRFEGNELLEEFDLRFYAGATLTTGEGFPIGTVCIYDTTPREFDEADEAYLELLAEEASDWIDLLEHRPKNERESRSESAGPGQEGPR